MCGLDICIFVCLCDKRMMTRLCFSLCLQREKKPSAEAKSSASESDSALLGQQVSPSVCAAD